MTKRPSCTRARLKDIVNEVTQRAIEGLGGWIACFPKARLAGQVFAGGVNDMGDIEGRHALAKAYEMGKASSFVAGT